jgi:hypothetical protein
MSRADRKRVRRAIAGTAAIERPLAELRRRADTYTPDQRMRLCHFVLSDLPWLDRWEIAERHFLEVLPPEIRRKCAANEDLAAVIVGGLVESLEPLHGHLALRKRALRNDIP